MSYTAWSVVFGEVPTEAKWNYLGTNDESFNDGTGIADDAIVQRHFADDQILKSQMTAAMGAWEELGRVELSAVGTEFDINPIEAKKYLKVIIGLVANVSGLDGLLRFNGDTGNNYAEQYSSNHGAQNTSTSAAQLNVEVGNCISGGAYLAVIDIYNPSGADKLTTIGSVFQTALTSATVPTWSDMQGMWNSNNQITRLHFYTDQNCQAGSSVVVLGHD